MTAPQEFLLRSVLSTPHPSFSVWKAVERAIFHDVVDVESTSALFLAHRLRMLLIR